MEVKVVESGMVTPSEETPRQTLWLSNLDLLVARAHTPTVYFYRPAAAAATADPHLLKAALSKALVPFYPLAGRLALDSHGRLHIDCTADGALFVVARSNSTLADLGDFAPSQATRDALVPSAPSSGDPPCILLMFQLTFFSCGGVCLGAAVHHTAADGLGALHFVNSWADIARGAAGPKVPPFLDRTLLRARTPPAVLFDHVEYAPKPLAEPLGSGQRPPFDSAILKLSNPQLDLLKSSSAGGKRALSTFKAVVAHVWRSACLARRLDAGHETRLYMTADARSRLSPPLPPEYLGNAIFRTSGVAAAGDIVSRPLDFGAQRIHEATARLDDEYVRSLVDFLEGKEDVRGLTKGSWKMPESDLWVISWQGLPLYAADFGCGRPAYMGRAALQFSGLVYISNGPENDGGLVLAVALEPESMARFKKIFYEDLRT